MNRSPLYLTTIALLLFFTALQIPPCIGAYVNSRMFEDELSLTAPAWNPSQQRANGAERYANGQKLLRILENLKNSTKQQEKQEFRAEALQLLQLPEDHIDVDLENWESFTNPLNLSLIAGETEIVQEILRHKDSSKNFDLHIPMLICKLETVYEHGSDDLVVMTIKHMSQEEKDYALSFAAIENHSPKIIKNLLAEGADPNALYENRYYMIQYIIEIFDDRISHLLYGDPKSYLACRENLGLLIAAKGFLADEEIEALRKAPHQEIRDIVLKALRDVQNRRHETIETLYQLTPKKCPRDLSAIMVDYAFADGNEIEKTIKKIELMRIFSDFDRKLKEIIASREGSAAAPTHSYCAIQ